VSARRIPWGTPPHNLTRRGEIATKTQKLRPALSVNTQPNHVLPLWPTSELSPACVTHGGVVRTDRHNAGEISAAGALNNKQCDLKAHPVHLLVGGW
jgi:hypothetical protein